MSVTCEAEQFIETFGEFVTSHTEKTTADFDALITAVRKINKLNQNFETRDGAIRGCVDAYLAKKIGERFPKIDDQLFQFQRWIGVKFKATGPEVFASRVTEPEDVDDKNEVWVRTDLLISSGSHQLGSAFSAPKRKTQQWRLHSDFPGNIGPEEHRYGFEALAILYRSYADILEQPELAEYEVDEIDKPKLVGYWIPSLPSIYIREQIKPVKRDPALVLHACGERFLCCLWDAQEKEEPLEAIIREFSEGGIVRRTRRRRR